MYIPKGVQLGCEECKKHWPEALLRYWKEIGQLGPIVLNCPNCGRYDGDNDRSLHKLPAGTNES